MNPYRAPSSPSPDSFPAAKPGVKEILLSFHGRIPRRTYWYWNLATVLIASIVMGLLWPFLMTSALRADMPMVHQPQITPLGTIVIPALLLPLVWISLALGVKRCHDRRKSGWWMAVGAIPIIGGIWMFVECGCLRGTLGSNPYGPDPT